MSKQSQVRPASSAELTPEEKEEIVDMASLSNLAYLQKDHVSKLLEMKNQHQECTVFNCKVFSEKCKENLEPEEIKHFCCEGVLQSMSQVRFFGKGDGAACYGGKYNGNTFISFRGTAELADWKANLDTNLVEYWSPEIKKALKNHKRKEPESNNFQIHRGFQGQFIELIDELSKYLMDEKQKPSNLYLTGHSLGGALASISSLFFSYLLPASNIRIVTFGAPRSVTDGYMKALNERRNVLSSFRFQADYDLVPIKNYGNLRHIDGGGKRDDNAIPPGEFTIRYKRIKRTNDDVMKNNCARYYKRFLWSIYDYGSSMLFHSQDTYQDKIAHAWSSIEGKEYEEWKNIKTFDSPKSVKCFSITSSLLNVSSAYFTCYIAILILQELVRYDESFTSAEPLFELCVRPVYDPDVYPDPYDDYYDADGGYGGYGGDDGGYGGYGGDDNGTHQALAYQEGLNVTIDPPPSNYGGLDPNKYWKELNLSQPPGFCESTPGYRYWGKEIKHGKCPWDYTCHTDYEKVGYTWMANAKYKMPYCLHNNVTCGNLKYCARYVALNGRPCNVMNKPCNETPSEGLLVAILVIIFVAFLCTVLIAVGNILSLFPKVITCCQNKKTTTTKEILKKIGKWLIVFSAVDALLKLLLFFSIAIFRVLDFLDTFIEAKCLSWHGMLLFEDLKLEAEYMIFLVYSLLVFKILSILASSIKFYIDPPNHSEKGRCSKAINCMFKKEKGIHWRWA